MPTNTHIVNIVINIGNSKNNGITLYFTRMDIAIGKIPPMRQHIAIKVFSDIFSFFDFTPYFCYSRSIYLVIL